MQKLFVYGSLRLGQPNENVLNNIGGTWKKGYVMGKLFQEGWGAELGSPGIRIDEKFEKVEGYVFYSEHLNEKWQELDDFEGEEYARLKTTVFLENGEKEKDVFIYALR